MANYLGKTPATYDRRDIKYADVRPSTLKLPTLPANWGHGLDFGPTGWKMLGNGPDDTVFKNFAGCGNCVWAGAAHEEMQGAHEARRPIPPFSGKTVVSQYSAYSGYNPQTGANDNGSNVRDVLGWRRTKGLLDNNGKAYKIGVYMSLEPGNIQALGEAVYLFESVGIGIEFPDSAMDQFNNGQVWSVVSGATIDGGHYVPVMGHPGPNRWALITWEQRQVMTSDFYSKYCDEVWAFIDMERYNAVTGATAENYKDVDLEKYLTIVANLKQAA